MGARTGHALVQPDSDGVVRRLNLAVDGESRWTHIAAVAADLEPGGRRALNGLPAFFPRPSSAPPRKQGEVLVSFDGPPNILDNAVKFSPADGVIACAISPSSGEARDTVVCTITDQGPGMSAEVVSKLFQRFSHHPKGRAGPVDGVGLDLAFVQSVVRGHGGVIECRSEPGAGTTFEITLPALRENGSGHGVQADEDKQ